MTIRNLLDPREFLVGDIGGPLAFDGQDSIGGLVARTFPARDGGYNRSRRDDFVGLEVLDLGDLLDVGDIAGGIDDEEVGRVFLGDNATGIISQSDSHPRSSRQQLFLPLNDLLIQILKTLLDFGHVDILPPGLLALPRWLAVLLRGIRIARLTSEDRHDRQSVIDLRTAIAW